MRRVIAALVACCIFATPSWAFWQSRDSNYNISAGALAGYTGPFDALGSTMPVWYGMRAASAAIAAAGTQALFNVTNASTTPANVTCDVLVASNGGMGLTANCSTGSFNGTSAATFCASGGGSCFSTIFYNQGSASSADMHNASANPAKAPTLVFSCIGTLPCFHFAGSSQQSMIGTWPAQSQPVNFTAVAERTPTAAPNMAIMGSAGAIELAFGTTANHMFGYAGVAVIESATDVVWHAFQVTFNTSPTAAINVDGTDFTGLNLGTTGVSGAATSSSIGSSGNGISDIATINWLETGLGLAGAGNAWTSTNRNALCHNSNIYYTSLGLSC